jgi:hypothetical protein
MKRQRAISFRAGVSQAVAHSDAIILSSQQTNSHETLFTPNPMKNGGRCLRHRRAYFTKDAPEVVKIKLLI